MKQGETKMVGNAASAAEETELIDLSKLVETEEGRATRLLLKRGRSYFSAGRRYITLTFHTASRRDAELIAATFGGSVYHHATGYQWRSSNRMTVDRVRDLVRSTEPADRFVRWRPLMLTENFYKAPTTIAQTDTAEPEAQEEVSIT
jgi:hypothetical protein